MEDEVDRTRWSLEGGEDRNEAPGGATPDRPTGHGPADSMAAYRGIEESTVRRPVGLILTV